MNIIGKLDAIHFLVEDAYGGYWMINHQFPFRAPLPCYSFHHFSLEELEVDFAA